MARNIDHKLTDEINNKITAVPKVGRRKLDEKGLYAVAWMICLVLARKVFKMKVKGIDNVPQEGPFLNVIGGHRSSVDVVATVVSTNRPQKYMAAKELFQYPLFRNLLKKIGAIPVDRQNGGKAAIQYVKESLDIGQPVSLFIEGRIASDRDEGEVIDGQGPASRIKAKTGAARIALEKRVPVLPTGLGGTGKIIEVIKDGKKVKVKFRRRKVGAIHGELIYPPKVKSPDGIPSREEVVAFTEVLQQTTQELFTKAEQLTNDNPIISRRKRVSNAVGSKAKEAYGIAKHRGPNAPTPKTGSLEAGHTSVRSNSKKAI